MLIVTLNMESSVMTNTEGRSLLGTETQRHRHRPDSQNRETTGRPATNYTQTEDTGNEVENWSLVKLTRREIVISHLHSYGIWTQISPQCRAYFRSLVYKRFYASSLINASYNFHYSVLRFKTRMGYVIFSCSYLTGKLRKFSIWLGLSMQSDIFL